MTLFGTLAGLSLLILFIALRSGSRTAMWWGVPIGMLLLNCRLEITLPGGLLLMPQTIVVYSVLLAVVLGGSLGPLSRLRWCWADLAAGLIPISQIVSNQINHQLGTFSILTITCLTLGPYVIGRLYLRSREDLNGALRPLMICLVILAVCVLFETFTGRNISTLALGKTKAKHQMRGGLSRAVGTLGSQIAFGMAMLTMWPWALEASRRARAGQGPRWWRLMPWMAIGAVFSSISRGPMLASMVMVYIYTFFRQRPALRLPLAVAGIAAVLLVTTGFDRVKNVLYSISGETELVKEELRHVVIDNQEYVYSGSDHRWLLFKAYAKPIRNAGLFGFGYDRKEAIGEATQYHWLFYSIDCNPLVILLAYGWVGVVLAYSLVFLTLWGLWPIAISRNNPLGPIAAALFGAIVAFQEGLLTVAFLKPFHIFWYLLVGAGVTVAQLGKAEAAAPQPSLDAPYGPGWPGPNRGVPASGRTW